MYSQILADRMTITISISIPFLLVNISDDGKFRMFEYYNFKTQSGPVAKNATLGHPAGNRTRATLEIFLHQKYWPNCQQSSVNATIFH